jgi:hypothetical protein
MLTCRLKLAHTKGGGEASRFRLRVIFDRGVAISIACHALFS